MLTRYSKSGSAASTLSGVCVCVCVCVCGCMGVGVGLFGDSVSSYNASLYSQQRSCEIEQFFWMCCYLETKLGPFTNDVMRLASYNSKWAWSLNT